MKTRRCVLALFLGSTLLLMARSAKDGVYTKMQAERGRKVYAEECAKCHAENLSGGDAPDLAGKDFLERWNGKSAADLFNKIRQTMPPDDPGHLSTRAASDLTACILSANSFRAGDQELDRDVAAISDIRIEP